MFEYAIRVLETQRFFNEGMVTVMSNPANEELEKAIKVLKEYENGMDNKTIS